jgi:hypothetical protein
VQTQVSSDKVSKNVLLIAAGMVASDPWCLDLLCEMAWQGRGSLAWNALSLLPFLKYQHAVPLAKLLVGKSDGKPLRSGVAWVLGELGVDNPDVRGALQSTIESLKRDSGASSSAWWESAFALEKLGALGLRRGLQGAEAIQLLHSNPKGSFERSAPRSQSTTRTLSRGASKLLLVERARWTVGSLPCKLLFILLTDNVLRNEHPAADHHKQDAG